MIYPPLHEQQAIAAYLDRKAAEIDAAMATLERLVASLKEYRSALISKVVTQGLDPNAPMKETGIDWLGKIPAHWQVKRLKYVVEVNPRYQLPEDISIPFVPMESVTENGQIKLEYSKNTNESSGYTRLKSGNLIVAKITPCFENGKMGIVPANDEENMLGSSEFIVLKNTGNYEISYLYFAMQGNKLRSHLIANMSGAAGQKRVQPEYLSNIYFPAPPLHEQTAIAAYLDRKTAEIDSAINTAQRKMEVLRSYRSSLISAVVTGKKPVPATV